MSDSQSNLTGKSKIELEIEQLYDDRMKLYNKLTRDIIKNNSDNDKKESLINNYRRNIHIIDFKIRGLKSKI